MNFEIREIKKADFPQWLELWNGYNKFYGRHGETALPTEITETTWKRFFDEEEPMFALVAEQNGRLLGLAHYLFHRSTTMIPLNCYMQDLFTDETVRGKGVGRALIEAVYKAAKARGSDRVYWQTHETNQTAMKLYNKVASKTGFLIYRQLL